MKFNLLINIISFVVILCIAIFIFIKSNKKNSEKIEKIKQKIEEIIKKNKELINKYGRHKNG